MSGAERCRPGATAVTASDRFPHHALTKVREGTVEVDVQGRRELHMGCTRVWNDAEGLADANAIHVA